MNFDQIIQVLQTFGFPVCVAAYLLWRIDPILREIAVHQESQATFLKLLTERLLDKEVVVVTKPSSRQ